MSTKEIRDHWQRLVGLRCLISGQAPQIHHAKGGSMLRLVGHHGVAMKQNDWLTIPLHDDFHEGKWGVEKGVATWERHFGSQVKYLLIVCHRLGVNVFERAGINLPIETIRREYQ